MYWCLRYPFLTDRAYEDHGQQVRASESFAGPVDFETPNQLTRDSESFKKIYWQICPWYFKIYRPSKMFTGPGLLAVVFHKPWCRPSTTGDIVTVQWRDMIFLTHKTRFTRTDTGWPIPPFSAVGQKYVKLATKLTNAGLVQSKMKPKNTEM